MTLTSKWLPVACALLVACAPPRLELRPVQPLDASPPGNFRAKRPEPLPVHKRAGNSPPVHTQLANGLQLYVMERPDLPLMTIAYVNRKAVSLAEGRPPDLAVLTRDTLLAGGARVSKDNVILGVQVGGRAPPVCLRGSEQWCRPPTWHKRAMLLG